MKGKKIKLREQDYLDSLIWEKIESVDFLFELCKGEAQLVSTSPKRGVGVFQTQTYNFSLFCTFFVTWKN